MATEPLDLEFSVYAAETPASPQAPVPAQGEADPVRAALAELVALKDMKDRLRSLHEMGHGTDYDDYYRLKPLAWAAARAALAAPSQQAEPAGWLRDQRGFYEGPETLDPLFVLFWDHGRRGANGATYTPLFATPAQPEAPPVKPLDDPRLQELFSTTIDGALTSGYQGVARKAADQRGVE